MPRYFFNRVDGRLDRDSEGSDLPDLAAATTEAIIFLGESIRDRPALVEHTGELRVKVTDENGSELVTVMAALVRNI